MTTELREVDHFRVLVYAPDARKPVVEFAGSGEAWAERPIVRARYRDDGYSVRIGGLWVELLSGSGFKLEREVEGLRTIVKWGDTMQLRQTFRVVLEIF